MGKHGKNNISSVIHKCDQILKAWIATCTAHVIKKQDSSVTSTALQSVPPLSSVQKLEHLSKDVETAIISLVAVKAKVDNLQATLMLWEDSGSKISIETGQKVNSLSSLVDFKHLKMRVK